ncbi:MAG: DNA polymerase III subunit delta' [Selenomonadaceae bacterium]|nr:DNA polymerase III subunit delta' [Selenomonadaceae bacterium]
MDRLPSWPSIVGHSDKVQRLRQMVAADRVPHGLLFYGPKGIGKRLTADVLAASLLCEGFDSADGRSIPCGVCAACREMKEQTHPDFHVVVPEGEKLKTIKIEMIREVIGQAQRVPVLSHRRVVIIDGADAMNEAAANSLLKTLEEPAGETVFILIAERQAAILPTILSRVTPIAFSPLSDDELLSLLKRSPEKFPSPQLLALIADGSAGRAQELAENGGLERRAEALAILKEIRGCSGKKPDMPEIFARGEKLGKLNRSELADYYHYFRRIIEDVRRMGSGLPPRYRDLQADLRELSATFTPSQLMAAADILSEAYRRLTTSNLTARLSAEALLIELRDIA